MMYSPCRNFCGVLLAVFLPLSSSAAEVRISGTNENLSVAARSARLDEVIRSLSRALNMRIDLPQEMRADTLNGTYSGSLRRVLVQILDGQSFVLKSQGGQLSILPAEVQRNLHAAAPMPERRAQEVKMNGAPRLAEDKGEVSPPKGWAAGWQ